MPVNRVGAAQVEELAGGCLLPALALTPANPALAGEVWALLKLLPYTTRWRLYGRLKARSSHYLGFYPSLVGFCIDSHWSSAPD